MKLKNFKLRWPKKRIHFGASDTSHAKITPPPTYLKLLHIFIVKRLIFGSSLIFCLPFIETLHYYPFRVSLTVSAKFGTYIVVSVNGTLVEAKMNTFTLACKPFIFNKCLI
jgi:hypothetical protein